MPSTPLPATSGVAAGLAEPEAATDLADAASERPAPFPGVVARANADAGSPPSVSASTAFSE